MYEKTLKRKLEFYNLDEIIVIRYIINSKKVTKIKRDLAVNFINILKNNQAVENHFRKL